MKKGKIKYTAFLLAIMLFLSVVQPLAPQASPGTADEAIRLKKGETLNGSFSEPGEVRWYKIEPTDEEIKQDTHMEIEVSGDFEGNVSVYPDKNRAEQDFTFDNYRAEITEGASAVIHMPHAWKGAYFIKVEYYGTFEEIETEENEGEMEEPQAVDYTIGYKGETLSPADLPEEACPVELSVNKREAGVEILKELRLVRDELLSKTDKGQELTSLYYKVAPFLVAKMTFDKKTKDQVYNDLVKLKPIFSELAEKGDGSDYSLTEKDQKAINELYEIVIQNVPGWLKPEIEKIAKEIGIDKLIDKKISTILQENGMAVSQSDTDRVIVKLKSGKAASEFQKKAKGIAKSTSIKTVKGNATSLNNMYVLDAGEKPETIAKNLEKLPEVEYAEPVYTYHKNASDKPPVPPFTDVQSGSQWSLKNTGQDHGKANADIRFEKLYETYKKKQLGNVVIAVVDTGVDHTLADLEEKVIPGYDFANRDDDAYDDEGHGTHVTGIIAAGVDNNYSMTGIHPNAKILPVKVLDASGSGDTEKIALGIKYAVDKGARVINLSLGGPYSRVIEEQLKYAASKNVTIVAASGNDGVDMLDYPAASKYSIAVGASNRLDIVSDFSSYGEGLDLVAPGADIPSLLPNGNVTYLSGTSMATPHVAAAAGLLLSENPKLEPEKVRRILTETADDIAVEEPVSEPDYVDDDYPVRVLEPGYDEVSGWGRLNVWSAFNTVGLGLKVNPLTDNDLKITGNAVNGTNLQLKDGNKLIAKGKAENGKFTIEIRPQQANKVLQLVANDGVASIRVPVKETPVPKTPKVKPVSDSDTVVTGQAEKGTTVAVRAKKQLLGEAKVDNKGQFKVKIKKQKAGTELSITAKSVSKKESKAAKIVVIDKTPPAEPKVKPVGDSDQAVTGKTESGAMVFVKHKGKTIGKKKADAKGNFKVAIKKQKAGTVLYVTAKDAAGNESKAVKVTVKDKTPPAVPKVNKVTDRDKFVSGKTEKNAVVYVKHKGKSLGKKKADAKGKFKVKIKKQKAGTTLSVTAKDAAGNTSKAAKVKVKKYKK
ncbi:S8 family peptidase [Siminovitchia fortis]|uniref:S8 family peptidase n=1 Tax=Siminovitchia fortis TaxID=254758 RepID=UPI00119F0D44|nr:Ig-like domain-containing protein [Siminovitchia fortis]